MEDPHDQAVPSFRADDKSTVPSPSDPQAGNVITSIMNTEEVMACLVKRGCTDLTDELDLDMCSAYPVSRGGFGDIYRGQLKSGLRIAIKTMRQYDSFSDQHKKVLKRAAHELYLWSKCQHPNIQRLLGVVQFRGQIGMVSTWEVNGNLSSYLQRCPTSDRHKISAEISDGLLYLHDLGMVHGDLKAANILISENGAPMLCDFGNASLQEYTLPFTDTSNVPGMTLRWAAPEIIKSETSCTKPADIYALGMTVLEIFTGEVPYREVREHTAGLNVLRGQLPERPLNPSSGASLIDDGLWSLLVKCWMYKPGDRPSAKEARNWLLLHSAAETVHSPAPLLTLVKNIANQALKVYQLTQGIRLNEKLWKDLGAHSRDAIASVVYLLGQSNSPPDVPGKLTKLEGVLNEIHDDIRREQGSNRVQRLSRFRRDTQVVDDMKRRLDHAIRLIQLGPTIGATKAKLDAIAVPKTTARLSSLLGRQPNAPDTSWDACKEYLANTRVELLNEIEAWVADHDCAQTGGKSVGGRIMLLTGVAGAGKTTIAHVTARRWNEQGLLGSSFFFERGIACKNTAFSLFSTVAADLGTKYPQLGELIEAAIEDNRSVLSAPLAQQFKALVVDPCTACASTFTQPVVIVMDVPDEAWNDDLLNFLRTGVLRLPSVFHVFVASRMRPELATLSHLAHVKRIELGITLGTNLHDTEQYIHQKLAQLARDKDLSTDWPEQLLRRQFVECAGGLFLWVRVTCGYLAQYDDPDEGLRNLLSSSPTGETSGKQRMDALYAKILAEYDWRDHSFVAGYQRVMGTAIASRTPLSMSAIQELYGEQQVASVRTLHRLSPLLTGMSEGLGGTEPVRVIHQSLHDFLVDRVAYTQDGMGYRIAEQDHSRTLGLLCLQYLSRELLEGVPCIGYLSTNEEDCPGIPKMADGSVSELLQYACRFWLDHSQDVAYGRKVVQELGELVKCKKVMWLEVAAAIGRCPSPHSVRKRVQELTSGGRQKELWMNADYADACQSLSRRLKHDDRLEEAVGYAIESVAIYRGLAGSPIASYEPRLASCIHDLAISLARVGRWEEALGVGEALINPHRHLVTEQLAKFTPDLALSLISRYLPERRHQDKELAEIKQAMELLCHMTSERPAELTSELALCLLSTYLTELKHPDDMQSAMEEVMKFLQRPNSGRYATFVCYLALCLMSKYLSELGFPEDAAIEVQEIAKLLGHLAAEQSDAFTPRLAKSLSTLLSRWQHSGR